MSKQAKKHLKMSKKRDENEDEQIIDFGDILDKFWEAFGSILGTKIRSKFSDVFRSDF